MNYAGLQRLSEEQHKALSSTDEELNKWERFKEDYEKLQTKIRGLPEQVTHDYMVPFGPLAFMPGQLIHTNEILVLLGDNWFAEMSAKQSCEVIDRRLADIDKSIHRLNEQKRLLETRTDFAKNEFTSDEVDITEEYNSDEDRKWRESHKQSVKREKQQQMKVSTSCHSDDDVMRRLESLQLQEMRGREMSRLDEESSQEDTTKNGATQKRKTVHWAGNTSTDTTLDLPADSSSDYTDSSASIDSDDSETNHGSIIHFKHSPRSEAEHSHKQCSNVGDGIVSPADIYRLYCQPKSILKEERSFEQVKCTVTQERQEKRVPEHHREPCPSPQVNLTAVQQHVVEKKPIDPQQLSELHTAQVEDKPPARVSKFKAMRKKKAT